MCVRAFVRACVRACMRACACVRACVYVCACVRVFREGANLAKSPTVRVVHILCRELENTLTLEYVKWVESRKYMCPQHHWN